MRIKRIFLKALLLGILLMALIGCTAQKEIDSSVNHPDVQPVNESPADVNIEEEEDEPTEEVQHSAFEVIQITPLPQVKNDIIIIEEISTFTLKGYAKADSVRFSTVFVDGSHMNPIVIGVDSDGTDGWSVKGGLPGKGKMLLIVEVNNKDGSTGKLSGIPLRSDINLPYLFDPREAKVGDDIVGWNIISYEVEPSSDIGFSGIIQFAGEKKLSGTFTHIPESDEMRGFNVCFTPDTESMEHLPKMMGDLRRTYFCASNYEEIKDQFGEQGNQGKATIIIQDYVIDHRPTETWNRAEFVQVEVEEIEVE